MDQSSDGEYERREAEAEAESWSAGYHCTLPNSLAHFFLSHIHISLSLRLTENSPWLSSASGPAPFRRQLGHDWMIQPSTALQVRDDINPPHTHTYTNQSDQNNSVLYSPSLSVDHHRACLLFNNASLTHICTETSMLQFIVQSSDLTHRKADFQTVGRFM